MALCVNQSGTWREITTNCVNVSGTWRNIETGCINQSGTWRCYGFYNIASCPLGSNIEGGYLICKTGSGTAWIVAPSSTQVYTTWGNRSNAVSSAESASPCGDWFVPSCSQLVNPGYTCRSYWDSYNPSVAYWSNTQSSATLAWVVVLGSFTTAAAPKTNSYNVRAFRCVNY